jgi:hypothetical protein
LKQAIDEKAKMLKKKVTAENEKQFNQGEAERKAIFSAI